MIREVRTEWNMCEHCSMVTALASWSYRECMSWYESSMSLRDAKKDKYHVESYLLILALSFVLKFICSEN